MNWVKTHKFISYLFPKYVWKIPNSENKIYLTFDDGPIPNVTEWVLDILKNENIKATFFCIGNHIAQYPDIVQTIKKEGHVIGNHSFYRKTIYSHLDSPPIPSLSHVSRRSKNDGHTLGNQFLVVYDDTHDVESARWGSRNLDTASKKKICKLLMLHHSYVTVLDFLVDLKLSALSRLAI